MKCPNCGREIPDGGLICEYCAQEIHIVPEYDTRVEETISETMSAIQSEMEKDEKKEQGPKNGKSGAGGNGNASGRAVWNGISRPVLVFFAVLAAVCLIALLFYYRTVGSASYYYGLAYDAMEAEEYSKAAELFERGFVMSDDHDHRLILMRAECLQKAGDPEAAAETAMELLEDPETGPEDLMNAYGRILSCYSAAGDYEAAAGLMDACTDQRVRLAYQEFMTPEVSVDPESGSYEDMLYVTVTGSAFSTVYFTLDGSTPDNGSTVYEKPFSMTDGVYSAAFVAVNPYGISSRIVRREYDIHPIVPDMPVILTESGTYSEQTMIEAVMPEDGTLYYTSDGTVPSVESDVYTEPVPMPEGTSNFRFAVINDAGVSSDITEVHYNLSVMQSLSPEEGRGCIMTAMMRIGQTVDAAGTISEGNAQFSYIYVSDTAIDGYGTFYLYSEFLTDVEGNSVQTGRTFAVHVPSGAVYLFDPSTAGTAGLLRL